MTFLVSDNILEVKRAADLEKDTGKRISQRLRVVLMDFYVNGVVFRKILVLSACHV